MCASRNPGAECLLSTQSGHSRIRTRESDLVHGPAVFAWFPLAIAAALATQGCTYPQGGTLDRLLGPEPREHFGDAGRVEAGDVVPAGKLLVALDSIQSSKDGEASGLFVINFDSPGPRGELSYMAAATVICSTTALTLRGWGIFPDRYGQGQAISKTDALLVVVDPMSNALKRAAEGMCKRDLPKADSIRLQRSRRSSPD